MPVNLFKVIDLVNDDMFDCLAQNFFSAHRLSHWG